MYIFNRITVNPQLPKRINRLNEIANNLWWAWNTEFLRLLKIRRSRKQCTICKRLWQNSWEFWFIYGK